MCLLQAESSNNIPTYFTDGTYFCEFQLKIVLIILLSQYFFPTPYNGSIKYKYKPTVICCTSTLYVVLHKHPVNLQQITLPFRSKNLFTNRLFGWQHNNASKAHQGNTHKHTESKMFSGFCLLISVEIQFQMFAQQVCEITSVVRREFKNKNM
jgi:hypothetical protein